MDTSKQAEAIEVFRKTNQRLHSTLDIVRVAWTRRIETSGQRYGSLIVEMGSIEAANRVISQGLVHEGEIKYYDRFIKEARII